MEHLTKQQIVLLTLLVSFVTSISTGIVTVSLMDQAPKSMTQTINRVVERTIEKVVEESTGNTDSKSASAIRAIDQISIAVEDMSKSVVRLKPEGGDKSSVLGLGIVVSKEGVIVTDKSNVPSTGNTVAVFYNGDEYPVRVVQSQIVGDIVFLALNVPENKKIDVVITPVSFASSIKLGQRVLALSGKESDILEDGIIEKIDEENIKTSISNSLIVLGSPLMSVHGDAIGIKTKSLESESGTIFYPLNLLKPIIPVIAN